MSKNKAIKSAELNRALEQAEVWYENAADPYIEIWRKQTKKADKALSKRLKPFEKVYDELIAAAWAAYEKAEKSKSAVLNAALEQYTSYHTYDEITPAAWAAYEKAEKNA